MNTLEIISLIFAIIVLVKFVVFLVKPDWLFKAAGKFGKKTTLVNVSFLAMVLVLGYLVLTNLTITQVVPGILIGSFLYGAMFLQSPNYSTLAKKLIKDKKMWLFWIPWLVIAIWVLIVLFL